MDRTDQPTRLDVDRVRQIIGVTASDHAYQGGRPHALMSRTLGCIEGYLRLDTRDPAYALHMIRAAMRAEYELRHVGTPEYDDIMAELESVHTGLGPDCAPACTPVDHRC